MTTRYLTPEGRFKVGGIAITLALFAIWALLSWT